MIQKTRHPLWAGRKGIFLSALPYHSSIRALLCIGCMFLQLTACDQASEKTRVQSSTTTEDLFPEKAEIRYARGFTLDYFDTYKVVNILNHFEEDSDTLRYILVQRGTPAPTHYPNSQLIEIPIRSMVAASSIHIALADFVKEADMLVGLGSLKYVSAPEVRENIAAGKVAEVGVGGSMNDELLISMQPDLVMAMGSPDATFSRYQTLNGAGIPVIINTEWLENSPLGRTEWVKLMAALVNKEGLANEKFAAIEKEYLRLSRLAQQAETRPHIVAGMPYKGSWFVPDGDSYVGQYLQDAATTYHWSDTEGKGSLALDFESVYPVALEADYWLNVGYVNSLDEINAKDVRYADFKAFQQGKVYNNNKKVNDLGANDYWESGAVNPQLILADLIKILHPELLPDHELVYYQQLN